MSKKNVKIDAQKSGSEPTSKPSDSQINERLVDILRANAVKLPNESAATLEPRRGLFSQTWALVGVFGLMIAAYFYGLLVHDET